MYFRDPVGRISRRLVPIQWPPRLRFNADAAIWALRRRELAGSTALPRSLSEAGCCRMRCKRWLQVLPPAYNQVCSVSRDGVRFCAFGTEPVAVIGESLDSPHISGGILWQRKQEEAAFAKF